MKTHFDPYIDPYDPEDGFRERYLCGAVAPEDQYNSISDWNQVTCKRCLLIKDKLEAEYLEIEEEIVNQMGDMAKKMA